MTSLATLCLVTLVTSFLYGFSDILWDNPVYDRVEVTIWFIVSASYMKWVNRTKFRDLDKLVVGVYQGPSLGIPVFVK